MIPNWLSNFNVIRPVLNGFILTNPSSLLSNQICCLSNLNMAEKKPDTHVAGQGQFENRQQKYFWNRQIDGRTGRPIDCQT